MNLRSILGLSRYERCNLCLFSAKQDQTDPISCKCHHTFPMSFRSLNDNVLYILQPLSMMKSTHALLLRAGRALQHENPLVIKSHHPGSTSVPLLTTFPQYTGPSQVRLHPADATWAACAAQHQGCSQGHCSVLGQGRRG